MNRWIRFLVVLILGAALGLLYGWVISPVEYTDTTPAMLRSDYKADFVLMVAEAYQVERNLTLARQRLSFLGDETPYESVQEAILTASQAGYMVPDLRLLRDLSDALTTQPPDAEASPP
jgi:hypothetical protein